jgi:hypothetical protein
MKFPWSTGYRLLNKEKSHIKKITGKKFMFILFNKIGLGGNGIASLTSEKKETLYYVSLLGKNSSNKIKLDMKNFRCFIFLIKLSDISLRFFKLFKNLS